MQAKILDLPVIRDSRGNLTVIEDLDQVPFSIRRVYYLYDVPSGASRGGHAHLELEQLIVAVSGSFVVVVDDGASKAEFLLNRPFRGLFIPPMHWRELVDFSAGAVSLVLASEKFRESDYIRDYEEFQGRLP